MATEFGTGKSIFILAIVVGCFAILWPKIFYPMLQSSVSAKPNIVPTAGNLVLIINFSSGMGSISYKNEQLFLLLFDLVTHLGFC